MVRQEAVNLPTVGSIPTSSAIPFGDTPNMSKAFPKVREAREALRARAEEIINLYMQNARQAVAAGEFEAAAKALQYLMDHIKDEDGGRIVDSSVDKQVAIEGPKGPTIQIGFALGGVPNSQPTLPPAITITEVKEDE